MASTADLEAEILAELEENPDAYVTPVNDVITIDPETRTIRLPASEMLFGVEEEKDVERKFFKCPRIVGDNIDLFTHQIYVNYIFAENKNGTFPKDALSTPYWCDDVTLDETGNYITFSWLLSGNVLTHPGFIAFAIVAKYVDGEALKTRWKTTPAVGTVLMTVPDSGQSVAELYPDVITQLLQRMAEVEGIATPEAMQNYVNAWLLENGVIDETLTQKNKAAPASAVGELKSDIDLLNQGGLNLKEDFIGQQVNKWLDEHPEATTTVQDHSLTIDKMVIGTLGYVTPEMFGAIGDGVTDDTGPLQSAINSGIPVRAYGHYLISGELLITKNYTSFKFNKITAEGCDAISVAGYCSEIIGSELITDDFHSCIKMGYASAYSILHDEKLGGDIIKYCGMLNISIRHMQGGYCIDMFKQLNGHINGITVRDTWMNGKIFAIKMTGDDPNYDKSITYNFNNNTFDNCSVEASIDAVYVENCTWYNVIFNNFRTNEMLSLPNRGNIFTFKNSNVFNSKIIETICSTYFKWIVENTNSFEVEISGITTGSGGMIANSATLKYDSISKKISPIFIRNDNQLKIPTLKSATIIARDVVTDKNYYGLDTFILENTSMVNVNFDSPYNHLGMNKIKFIVPNISSGCVVKYMLSGNYENSGAVIPETFEPTIYNVYFIDVQKSYIEKSPLFNGWVPDVINTGFVDLPISSNNSVYIKSDNSDVLYKKLILEVTLEDVLFNVPEAPFMELRDSSGNITKSISPSSFNITTTKITKKILTPIDVTSPINRLTLRLYGYSSPSEGRIRIRIRGIEA